MRTLRRWLALACALAGIARGQSVQWDPPGGALPVGRTSEFDLVCRDCQLRSTPQPPQIPGLVLRYIASSAGDFDLSGIPVTKYVFWGYWSKMQELVIPSFVADTDHGAITVPEAHFEPIPATVGRNKEPLSSAASAVLKAPPEVWVGQVFPLAYTIDADANYQPDWSHTPPDWVHDGIVAEDWDAPVTHDTPTADGKRSGLQYRTRAIALKSGDLELRPERELVNLNVGISVFGPPTPQYEQFSVPCDPVTVTAKALPPAPPGFMGGVGHFTLASHVAPQSAAPREPITWTVELSGTGNWPQIRALPPRAFPPEFQVVHPQLQRTPEPGKVFDARLTEDVVLVPSRPGHFVLPAVTWVYFDPDTGGYQTASTAPTAIDVVGTSTADSESLPTGETQRLPPDPLPLGDLAPLPWDGTTLLLAALCPFALALAGWIALAVRRARATDPALPRREAWTRQRRRLLHIRDAAQAGDQARLRSLLLAWQHDAVTAWNLSQRSPTPESIPDRAESLLWAEADAAIFGPTSELPDDWVARADHSLAEMPPPPFRLGDAFLPRNIFPFLALFAAALLPALAAQARADAWSDYAAGKFSAAEQAWRRALPADAAGKHDVSLALAQQGRWGDAALYASAAFVRDPAQAQIQAQFSAACERSSIDPGPLSRFLAPGPMSRAAEKASPAVWQRLVVACSWLAALGLGLLLLTGYRIARSPWWPIAGLALFAAGLFVGLGAWAGARAYGSAGDARALWVVRPAVMRSIPTEVLAGQMSTPLPPGSIGIPDKTFLSWTRLRFDDGSTGWVRRADLAPLWK